MASFDILREFAKILFDYEKSLIEHDFVARHADEKIRRFRSAARFLERQAKKVEELEKTENKRWKNDQSN